MQFCEIWFFLLTRRLATEQSFELSFSVHFCFFPFEFYFLISPHFVSFKEDLILSKTNALQVFQILALICDNLDREQTQILEAVGCKGRE